MIDGFKEETKSLSKYEASVVLPQLIKSFQKRVDQGVGFDLITSTVMIKMLSKKYDITVSEPSLRKVINVIRRKRLIFGFLATSKGYRIASSKKQFEIYLNGLKKRMAAIKEMHDKMEEQYNLIP